MTNKMIEDIGYAWEFSVLICTLCYFGAMLMLGLQDFSILISIVSFFVSSIIFVFVLCLVAKILLRIQEAKESGVKG